MIPARQYATTNLGLIQTAATAYEIAAEFRAMTEATHRIIVALDREFDRRNHPTQVAGLCGRYTARAGLAGAYHHPDARDALVADILAGRAHGTMALTPTNRAVVAAAALRGWVTTHA